MPRACNTSFRTCTSGALRSARSLGVSSIPALRIRNAGRPRILAAPTRASSPGHNAWPEKGSSASPNTPAVRVDPQQQLWQQQQSPSQKLCRVTFSIKYQTGFGRSLKVIGHGSALGAWNLASAPDLSWGMDDVWTVTLDLPQSSVVEYKYAMIDSYGNAVAWQSGNNNVLAIKLNQEEMTVTDNWEGAPGASVASNGAVVPRQNQLLNWASEMEMMLSSSKNELRQSRVELMAAREEARVARSQVDLLQKKVAEYKVVDKRQKAEIEALQVEVNELREKNTESAQGFTAALETAHSMLEELDLELGLDGSFADIAEDLGPISPTTNHFNAPEHQTPEGPGASDSSAGEEPSAATNPDDEDFSSWRSRQRTSFTNFISPVQNPAPRVPPDEDQPPMSPQQAQAGMPEATGSSDLRTPAPPAPKPAYTEQWHAPAEFSNSQSSRAHVDYL